MDVIELTKFIESQEFSSFLFPFKLLALVVSVVFIYGLYYYLKDQASILDDSKRRAKDFLSFQKFIPPVSYVNAAKEISYLLNKKQYETAILKTEVLFIKALKRFGYKGNDLKELASDENVPDREDLIKLADIAKQVRKEKGYRVDITEIEKLFESYEDALMRLDIITKKHEE
ncbi:MAG: hypothetical protein PHD31_01060 [Candidatus Pacebacteria bacterium]|nr:hypothetical protein [Candidatus Paceibacterota bacterium]